MCSSSVYHLQQMFVHGVKTNDLPYSPPEQGNLILHHKCCQVLAKNTTETCDPSVYLKFSSTKSILTVREKSKISSLLHLEVGWNEVAKWSWISRGWVGFCVCLTV